MTIDHIKKTNSILFFTALVIAGLYCGASLLIPFTFAVFLSALILPFADFLERRLNFRKLSSSFWSTLVVFISVGLIFFFMIHQLDLLLKELMATKDTIVEFMKGVQQDIASRTGFSLAKQEEVFNNSLSDILNVLQKHLTNFLINIFDVLFQLLIIHIYLFLLLLNREKFVKFLLMYIPKEKEEHAQQIIKKTSRISHKYFWGRAQVMILLAIMYFITFTAYDLRYSGSLILFGALITIIPYIGPFISGLLPVFVMLIFGDSTFEILSFSILIIIIQMIESYVLEPVIIGSEVQQSPLFVIIAVFLGGAVWGGAGLILFVPIFAILKIIFDNTTPLKPIGFLMGYGESGKKDNLLKRLKKKIKH